MQTIADSWDMKLTKSPKEWFYLQGKIAYNGYVLRRLKQEDLDGKLEDRRACHNAWHK